MGWQMLTLVTLAVVQERSICTWVTTAFRGESLLTMPWMGSFSSSKTMENGKIHQRLRTLGQGTRIEVFDIALILSVGLDFFRKRRLETIPRYVSNVLEHATCQIRHHVFLISSA